MLIWEKGAFFVAECDICGVTIDNVNTGEPCLEFKGKHLCYKCYLDIIPEIYSMAGAGDGGLIHIIFKDCVSSPHNRRRRRQISGYKTVFNELGLRYKFKCANCEATENLTIDHIKPVSKGGTDDPSNLQLLCKSCNSSKGAKYEE